MVSVAELTMAVYEGDEEQVGACAAHDPVDSGGCRIDGCDGNGCARNHSFSRSGSQLILQLKPLRRLAV